MANFAKAQLLKYGWKEGKGLGKNENGLTEALKPTLKFDHAGVGYSEINSEHWWETLYDNAAKNVKVDLHDNKVSLSTIDDLNVIDDWNTVSSKKSKKTEQHKYGNFLKTSTLYNGHLIQDTSVDKKESTSKDFVCIPMMDEQLCESDDDIIAHKTARQDLLSGKLERIAQQDRLFLNVGIDNVSQLDTGLVKEKTMTHRKTGVELDTEESDNPEESQGIIDDQNTSQHETKDHVIRVYSKSARKNHKKRLNKLTQQFSICSLKKNIHSEYNSSYDEELARFKKEFKSQLDIKSKKCNKRKRKNKQKKSFELCVEQNQACVNIQQHTTLNIEDKLNYKTDRSDLYWFKPRKRESLQHRHICQSPKNPVTSSLNNLNNKANKTIEIFSMRKKKNMNIEQEIQEQTTTGWKYFDVGKEDLNQSPIKCYSLYHSLYYNRLAASSKISFCKSLSTSSTEGQSHVNNSDDKLHNKDKKIRRKSHQQKQKKQLEKVINPVNFCTDDLNTVIKKLTTFDLTEEVSANAFKKKLTQTHRTSV